MAKTIKQIADELGLNKQKIYRYIKSNRINESHQKNGMMYYDDVAESIIKKAFLKNSVSDESHQNHINKSVNDVIIEVLLKQSETLQKELKIKNNQIEELNNRLLEITSALVTAQETAKVAQALHAGTIQQQIENKSSVDFQASQDQTKKIHWWQRKNKN